MTLQKIKGQEGESISVAYLRDLGWQILDRNFTCRYGELDIVARDLDEMLVFCEVKYYQKNAMVHPLEMIGDKQIFRLKKTIDFYIYQKGYHHLMRRLDIMIVRGSGTIDIVPIDEI